MKQGRPIKGVYIEHEGRVEHEESQKVPKVFFDDVG